MCCLGLLLGLELYFNVVFLGLGAMVALQSVSPEASEAFLPDIFLVAAHLVEVDSFGEASNASRFETVKFGRVELELVAFAESFNGGVDEVVAGHALVGVGLDGAASAAVKICSEANLQETGF